MSSPEFKKAVTMAVGVLSEAFNRKATEATFRAYEIGLAGIDPAAIERGTARALRQSRFMPAPAELRELSGELTTEARVLEAWRSFDTAVGRYGGYKSVQFDDPVLVATVRQLGGWQRVCGLPVEEFSKWMRKDFERIYRELLLSDRVVEDGVVLVGFHESTNRLGGYGIAPPERIETGLPALPDSRLLPVARKGIASDLPQLELKKVP